MIINKINYLKKIFEKFQNEHILVVDLDNYLYKDLTILEENSKSLSTFNTQDLEIWINTYKVKKPVIIHNHVSNNSNFSEEDIIAYKILQEHFDFNFDFYLINLNTQTLKEIGGSIWELV